MKKIFADISDVFIKRVLFVSMALFCYLYTVFLSDFAEWSIKFPFLNFPVFIGEVLLFVALVLVAIYFFKNPLFLNRKILLILIGYLLWIMTKASLGYAHSGPLALRTAALFYYPLFAFAGYVLFERTFYNSSWRWGVLGFLFLNIFFAPISDYFLPSYWLLALGFCLYIPSRNLKWLGIALLGLQAVMSRFFFTGSRSHTIGVIFLITSLTCYFVFGMLRISWRKKAGAVLVALISVAGCLFVFGDRNAMLSMISLKQLRDQFAVLDRDIQRTKKYYSPKKLNPQIYDRNRDNQMAQKLFNSAPAAVSKRPEVKPETQLEPAEIRMIDDSAKYFVSKAMTAKEDVIHERANAIYQKTREALERDNAAVIEQAKADLNQDIKIFIDESGGQVEKDLQEALQNLSLALQHDTERSLTDFKKSVDDASQSTITKLKETIHKKEESIVAKIVEQKADRSLEVACNNIYFRLFIWRDMLDDLKENKAWLGLDFGHPQRSISIEILDWARIEWQRDGWITPHNSFLHMIYRGGIVGVLCVMTIIGVLVYLVRGFLKIRSVWGGILIACLMYWVGISNFLVFLELPYNAIPVWTFLGMTVAYYHSLEKGKSSHG